MRVYFKIKSHEILLADSVLMDCNVSRKGKFWDETRVPKFKVSGVPKPCPEKAATAYQLPSGIAFEISSKTLFQNGLILPATSKVLVPECRHVPDIPLFASRS